MSDYEDSDIDKELDAEQDTYYDEWNEIDDYMADLYDAYDDIPADYYEPDEDDDPDPETDRYQVWTEQGYASVYEVSRLIRWRRFIEYDYQVKVYGPLYRMSRRIAGFFKPCPNCHKRGFKLYYFSDACSEKCSREFYAKQHPMVITTEDDGIPF